MKKRNAAVFAVLFLVTASFGQGSLTPPGAPAPTMKTLDELDASISGVSNAVDAIQDEVRTPISAANHFIGTSGSYYLTADLVLSGADNGVIIVANNVTLDLNGFSIRGAGSHCSGITLSDRDDVVIKNGTIRDCYYYGVAALRSARCRFENLRIINNGQVSDSYDGIHAGPNTTIKGCLVMENGSGIEVDGESTITGNQIVGNRNDGLLLTGSGSYVAENIVKGNGDNYDLSSGNQLNILLSEIPESLDWPCSVKLAGTLTCTNTGVNGIAVNANDVSIDLDGHALIGPGSSSGHGIYQENTQCNLCIKNGKIEGWRGSNRGGIRANGEGTCIHAIQASTNYYGIVVGKSGTLTDCVAHDNVYYGIYTGSGFTLRACTAHDNTSYGIRTGDACSLVACVAYNNALDGIRVNYSSILSDCIAYGNDNNGIYTFSGSMVHDCLARNNGGNGIYTQGFSTIRGCSALYNTKDGICCSAACQVVENNCLSNGYSGDGAGIHAMSSESRIEGNNVMGNDRGIDVDQLGNFIVRNTASANTVNYDIVANNKVGVIVSAPNSGAISGSTGGSGVGSTDPWANFTY